MQPYDPRHFRFPRTSGDSPEIECFDPPDRDYGLTLVLIVLLLVLVVVLL
jgi:hypothetical protein